VLILIIFHQHNTLVLIFLFGSIALAWQVACGGFIQEEAR